MSVAVSAPMYLPQSWTSLMNHSYTVITLHNELLFFKDWFAAGVIKVSDICYEVVPGYLPVGAIHEEKNVSGVWRDPIHDPSTMGESGMLWARKTTANSSTLFCDPHRRDKPNSNWYPILQDATPLWSNAWSEKGGIYETTRISWEILNTSRILASLVWMDAEFTLVSIDTKMSIKQKELAEK